jgi:hypothetical protein
MRQQTTATMTTGNGTGQQLGVQAQVERSGMVLPGSLVVAWDVP